MVCWIVFLAKSFQYTALTIGTVLFALVLVGLTLYLVLSIKSIRLHQRQVNFVDSVTHELKSPIAAVRLYLDTLTGDVRRQALRELRRVRPPVG